MSIKYMLCRKVLFVCLLFSASSLTGWAQTNVFPATGNVGIGTTSPGVLLHLNSNTAGVNPTAGTTAIFGKGSDASFNLVSKQNRNSNGPGALIGELGLQYGNIANSFIRFHRGNGPSDGFISMTTNNGTERFRINAAGNVGIGTTTPTYRLEVAGSGKWTGNSSSYTEIHSNTNGQYLRQFANNGIGESWIIRGYAIGGVQAIFHSGGINVNGMIKAKEVNVTAVWPDYVFRPGYKLMPLAEVEAYIQENGRLPNIPGEAEVMEKGVNLGEINAKLLEKIEELTLYVIGQQGEMESQRQAIADQSKKISLLLKLTESLSEKK